MNAGSTEPDEASDANLDRPRSDRFHTADSQHQQHFRTSSQTVPSQQSTPLQHQHASVAYPASMHHVPHQGKLQGQSRTLFEHPLLQYQQPPRQQFQQPAQLQRHATQRYSVPRTVSTPSWLSGADPAIGSTSSNINTASAPSSSYSSGPLLPYWEHNVASDNESSTMSSGALSASGPHQLMTELGHHRYTSGTPSLHAFSPSGVVAHATSSHMSGSASASSQGHLGEVGSNSYHPYRPPSMQSMSTSHMYHAAYQPTPSPGLPHSSSMPATLASPSFVYGPSGSGSSASLGSAPSTSYEPISAAFSTPSQYVSHLPPALSHDQRFYPLNPFEIKHRRRTTKTQFRVLESTFREIPKPNATLRKQISAQLDMPVRAVQIWFQNRRAKAKAMERKRQTDEGSGEASQDQQSSATFSGVPGPGYNSAEASERRSQGSEASPYAAAHNEQLRGHASYYEPGSKPMSQSVDLPPLRMQTEHAGQESYPVASGALTLPSINVESGTARERRAYATSMSLEPSTLTNNPLRLGYASIHDESHAQHVEAHSTARSAYGLPGFGLGQQFQATSAMEASTSSSNSLSAGMPPGQDRSNRASNLPASSLGSMPEAPTLPSTSPRPPPPQPQPRFWSASHQ